MISRLNKLIVLLAVVSICLYIVVLNRDPVSIRLAYDTPLQASVGIVLIVTFILGFLFAAIFGLFFGVKAYFRERRLSGQARDQRSLYDGILKARSAAAAGDTKRAEELWEQNLRRDPKDIISKIGLAAALETSGRAKEALKIIDQARVEEPGNLELLFKAAELNRVLGNNTAAVDNLALSLSQAPSIKAAVAARDLSEELGRLEDALEYHYQAERLGLEDSESDSSAERIEYKKLVKQFSVDKSLLADKLLAFAKKHPHFPEPLKHLACLELDFGRNEEAAEHLVKAAKIEKSPKLWHEAAKIWTKEKSPERAISSAKMAARDASGESLITADLELARTYAGFGMYDEAKAVLDRIPERARSAELQISDEANLFIKKLRAFCLLRAGVQSEAAQLLAEVLDIDKAKDGAPLRDGQARSFSPTLSTP